VTHRRRSGRHKSVELDRSVGHPIDWTRVSCDSALTSLPFAVSLLSLSLSLEKEMSPLLARDAMSMLPIPSLRAFKPSISVVFLGDAGALAMNGLDLDIVQRAISRVE